MAEPVTDLERAAGSTPPPADGPTAARPPYRRTVGPALNGRCKKFLALLRDAAVTTIVVEHRHAVGRWL